MATRIEAAPARTLMTVAEIADRWGCSEGLVRKMEKHGRIVGVRIGTLLRIPIGEVEKIECQSQNSQFNVSGVGSP